MSEQLPVAAPTLSRSSIPRFILASLPLVLLAVLVSTGACAVRFLESGDGTPRGLDVGFLADTPSRTKIDLAGTWSYSIEGGPSGSVKVPSAYDFTGHVLFEREFEILPEQMDQYRFLLVMLGVNYECEVSINGDFITQHVGGSTSFVQPVPDNTLQAGPRNVIKVSVTNELDPRRTLPLRSPAGGWRNYGGILRDVYLLAVPRLFISDMYVTSRFSGDPASARVSVRVSMDGSLERPEANELWDRKGGSPGVYVEILDKISGFLVARSPFISAVSRGNEWDTVRAELHIANPKMWSPDSPELYLVRAFLAGGSRPESPIIDEYGVNHGICTREISRGSILMNGRRIVVKGVVWMEDYPDFGSAIRHREMEKDVALIKSLGANAIRFWGRPPHPYMLNLCDRYGLLALEELPAVGVPSSVLAEEYYQELAATMMREMIIRDRQHVSVLAWGIGDEFDTTSPVTCNFVQGLVRLARTLDGRPTYYGSRFLGVDDCAGLVDFVMLNVHAADVKGFKKKLSEWKVLHHEDALILGRLGTEVQQDNRNGYSDPLSYEAQARFFIQRFDVLRALDYDGAVVWSFNDWKGDRPALTVNSGDPWVNSYGLVSYEREKRLAYDALRAVFRGEKFVALPMGNYSAGAPIVFVVAGLVLLIGSAYFYNASRRFRESLNRSVLNLYNFFADVRDQRIVSVFHTTVLGLVVSVAVAIVGASLLHHFKQSAVLDQLLSALLVSDGLKESVVRLVWNPLLMIVYLSVLLFLVLVGIFVLVMALSFVSKAKIFPYHAYVVTAWSTAPLLVLVPVGMILYRVLDSPVYVVPTLVLLVLLLVWVVLRLLKGIAIIFDARQLKVYAIGFASLVCLLSLVYAYYDYTQSMSMYVAYFYNVMLNAQ